MLLLRKVRMMLRCVGGALFTLLLLRQRHTCAPQSSDNLRKFQSFVVWGTFTTTCPSQHGDNLREFQSYQFEPTCSSSRLKLIVRTKQNVLFWQQLPLHLSRALLLHPFVRKVAFALSFGKNDFFLHEYFTIWIWNCNWKSSNFYSFFHSLEACLLLFSVKIGWFFLEAVIILVSGVVPKLSKCGNLSLNHFQPIKRNFNEI